MKVFLYKGNLAQKIKEYAKKHYIGYMIPVKIVGKITESIKDDIIEKIASNQSIPNIEKSKIEFIIL